MRNFSKEEKIGIVGTLLVHVVLGVVLWLLVLNAAAPANDPVKPEEEPEVMLEVEFEVDETLSSSGAPKVEEQEETKGEEKTKPQENNQSSAEEPEETASEDEQPTDESQKTDVPETPENPMELDNTVKDYLKRIEDLTTKLEDIKKKKEEEKKKINDKLTGALTNFGKPEKSEKPKKPTTDLGENAVKGINLDLKDRKTVGGLVKPKYEIQDDGVIVVDIIVTPEGNVRSAEISPKTINANLTLLSAAKAAAMQTKFNSVDSKEDQHGTITYNFELIE